MSSQTAVREMTGLMPDGVRMTSKPREENPVKSLKKQDNRNTREKCGG